MNEPILITTAHCEKLGYCLPGMVRFAKRYNLNIRKFIREGMMSDEFPPDDSHTIALIDIARKTGDQQ